MPARPGFLSNRPESPMDAVTPVLDAFHLHASVFERARFCGHWALTHAGGQHASFHLVSSGHCWLDRMDGGTPLELGPGDLLVMPRDAPHRLGPAPDIGPDREPDRQPLDGIGDGPGLVCGYFAFDEGMHNPILDALPDYLVIRADEMRDDHSLQRLVELLIHESAREATGGEAMVNHLADALFIGVIRHHLATAEQPVGLLAALADPALHRALAALHSRPAEPWTLDTLASNAAVSRSVLAERFTRTLGVAPMTWLFRWRMQLAVRRLRGGEAVASVAATSGYATESGFAKAFARHFGYGPGAARRGVRG
jgi:AraC-like DNA-binding protein